MRFYGHLRGRKEGRRVTPIWPAPESGFFSRPSRGSEVFSLPGWLYTQNHESRTFSGGRGGLSTKEVGDSRESSLPAKGNVPRRGVFQLPLINRACPHRSGGRRLPVVNPLQGASHESRALIIAQSVREAERRHGLLVGQQVDRARPVGAPQAAVETECVENCA